MKSKLLLKIACLCVFMLAALMWGDHTKASAASWCGVLAPALKQSKPPKLNDCITYSQNYNALTNLSTSDSSATLKSKFIADMHNFEGGQHLQKVGAAFVESNLWQCSSTGCESWEERVNDPDVVLDVVNYSYTKNTAYDPALDKDIQYGDTDTRESVIFKVGGTVYFAIKLDCGNPVGDMNGLPRGTFNLDGVKIDNSGTGTYGGGTSGSFSDDKVSITGPSNDSDTANPFHFDTEKGGSQYTVSVAAQAGYTVKYAFCEGSVSSGCDNSFLLSHQVSGTSFKYTFRAGNNYHMRWIYTKITTDAAPSLGLADHQPTCSSPGDIEGVAWDSDDFNQYFDSSAANKMVKVTRNDGVSANLSATSPETNPPGTVGHNHGFDFIPSSLPGYSASTTYTYTFKATGAVNSSGAASALTASASKTMTAPGCITGSCSITTTPATVEPGQAFNFTAVINYSGGTPPAGSTVNVNIPGIGSASGTSSGGASDTVSGSSPGNVANDYAANWSLSNPAKSGSCNNISIKDLPYFKVFGADISAGGDFNCTGANTGYAGTIGGWYNNGAPFAGASTQFAATSIGKIIGVNSAQNGPPAAPAGATFANSGTGVTVTSGTGSDPSPQLGGNFGGNHCLYLPTAPGTSTPLSGNSGTVGSNPLNGGAVTASGPFTLTGGNLASPQNVSLFVNGDVYITAGGAGGITYNSGWTAGKVPSFVLVATGNIYIDPNVTELDGIYVANGGNIYTCATGNGTLVPKDSLYSNCNQQLTVYGAFVANQIKLMRSLGTLKNAPGDAVNPNPSVGGANACANGGSSKFCAGEIFNFSPELYLSNPAVAPPNDGAIHYDAISALPPVL